MKIYTLWEDHVDGDSPWLVAAVDNDLVEDEGWPESYDKERHTQPSGGRVRRELVIEFPDAAVVQLFTAPKVAATKTTPGGEEG